MKATSDDFYDTINCYCASSDNYLLEWHNKPTTLVFFSGNGLIKDTVEDVTRICEHNLYEWQNLSKDLGDCNKIFVRDLKKSWYLCGVNDRLNSVESVLAFFKEVTKGTEVVTVGNSAGGFAAVLFGCLLGASRVFSFSGQFTIEYLRHAIGRDYYRYLFQALQDNPECLLDLLPLIHGHAHTPIWYIWPQASNQDYRQYVHVKNMVSIKSIRLKHKTHGAMPSPRVTQWLLLATPTELQRFHLGPGANPIAKWQLDRRLFGTSFMVREICRRLCSKLSNLLHSVLS